MKLELLRKAKRESERFYIKKVITAVFLTQIKMDWVGFEPPTT
jgi:hypothetical protein